MADNVIYYQTQPLLPLDNRTKPTNLSAVTKRNEGKDSFSKLLDQEISGVKFSQHALDRMKFRNLQFSSHDLMKLNDAVEKIAQKGAKESLVYMRDVALVVSVTNKTVITAMDGKSAKDTIFTNIDSAVIL
ncbi:TIGR02530 family flagellar biosynthesis protein [Anaerosinus massiliensis]|uniref:TIGR02530 family flagellar biosynthesis protein n=1 Tax=Massilibacillus massiliensis TaxID=1806837 RepID=UPI000AA98364|nr:TIGR02530 family flagellar biosynthesis protein [Massilibacillus massiliensis]